MTWEGYRPGWGAVTTWPARAQSPLVGAERYLSGLGHLPLVAEPGADDRTREEP